MSYIPEYHENYYNVEGTAYNQGKVGIGTFKPIELLHVSGGNMRLDGTGYIDGDLNVSGNLNVYGESTMAYTATVAAEDKNLELNVKTMFLHLIGRKFIFHLLPPETSFGV